MADSVGTDRVLHFAIPGRDCRGRAVRLDAVANEILAAHAYPPVIRDLLAEALCLTALLGSLLKDERGKLTMQAQTEQGAVKLLAADFFDGGLRGYVDFDADALAEFGETPSLMALFGKGALAITFDPPPPGRRYQGIVPLEGATLADAVAFYFRQSEQIPSFIRVAIDDSGDQLRAGGMLVQHLADGEEGRERLHVRLDHPEWEHVEVLASSVTDEELLNDAIPLEETLWRLFSESDEVRVISGKALVKGCRCNVDHIRDVLARFPAEDREDMTGDDGLIGVDCAFCNKKFEVNPASLHN